MGKTAVLLKISEDYFQFAQDLLIGHVVCYSKCFVPRWRQWSAPSLIHSKSILVEIYVSKDGNKECWQGSLNFKAFLSLLRKLEGSPSLSLRLLGRSYSSLHYLGLVNMGFGLSIKTFFTSFADKKLSCDVDSPTDTSPSSELFHATADAIIHVIA